jgi:hypothetical protein
MVSAEPGREVQRCRNRVSMSSIAGASANESLLPHRCGGALISGELPPHRFTLHDAFDTLHDGVQQGHRSAHRRDAWLATACTMRHSTRAIVSSRGPIPSSSQRST